MCSAFQESGKSHSHSLQKADAHGFQCVAWCWQALEAIKITSGVGQPLSRRLLLFDALAGRFTRVQLRPKVGPRHVTFPFHQCQSSMKVHQEECYRYILFHM